MAATIHTSADAAAAAGTEARILRAALRLFGSKGYGAVGIREIALEAGVSTAALYHYMRTKEDLLVALMTDRLRRITLVGRIARDEFRDAERRLTALVRVHIISHARFPDGVVDEEVRSLSATTRPPVIAMRDEYEAVWDGVLHAGVASGVFEIENTRFARLALLEMCNGVMHWYRARSENRLHEIADGYADMALALVRAHRGSSPVRLRDLEVPPAEHYADIVSRVYDEAG